MISMGLCRFGCFEGAFLIGFEETLTSRDDHRLRRDRALGLGFGEDVSFLQNQKVLN